MEMIFFLKGALFGFSIAAPVGPMGVLCIRRTLASGMRAGLISGLGTATADALYGMVAVFGITAVTVFLLDHLQVIRLAGGIFLCYLGLTAFRSVPATAPEEAGRGTVAGIYGSALVFTLTNPMTILSFAALFAAMGVSAVSGGEYNGVLVVAGVFAGSAAWWLLLSGLVSVFRERVGERCLSVINKLAGLAIVGFGLVCVFWG